MFTTRTKLDCWPRACGAFVVCSLLLAISVPASPPAVLPLRTAIEQAERLAKSPKGQPYQYAAIAGLGQALANAMVACPATSKREPGFALVFVIASDGRVEEVLHTPKHTVAQCVASKLKGVKVPRPPRAGWLVHLDVGLAPSR